MARKPDSTSSTDRKRPKGARSEPQASEDRTARPGLVLIGRITGAHGLEGELRLESFAEDLETLRGVTRLRVEGERPDAPDRALGVRALARSGASQLRLRLEGVGDRDTAEGLRGRRVWANAGELASLGEGEFYGHQLIGCALESQTGAPVGIVRDLWRTGAPDVLVVQGTDGRELLIPAAFLREVDPDARRAVVELVPGLLDPDEAA